MSFTGAPLGMRSAAQESAAVATPRSAGIAEAAATLEELSSTASSIAVSAQTSSGAAQQTSATVAEYRARWAR